MGEKARSSGLVSRSAITRTLKMGQFMKLARQIRQFLVSEEGPTAVEYAVMLALIVVVCLTAIQAIGTNANATFQSIAAAMPSGSAS